MKQIFIDVESSGVDPKTNSLLQLAGKILIDGRHVESFNFKSAPFPEDIHSHEALEVNGMNIEMISSFPPPRETYAAFVKMLDKHCSRYNKKDKLHFLGYNGDFDADMIRGWFLKNGNKYFGAYFWWPIVDVANLAGMRLMSRRHEMENFRLMTVAAFLGIEIDPLKAHDAMYDIEITMEVFRLVSADIPMLRFMNATA